MQILSTRAIISLIACASFMFLSVYWSTAFSARVFTGCFLNKGTLFNLKKESWPTNPFVGFVHCGDNIPSPPRLGWTSGSQRGRKKISHFPNVYFFFSFNHTLHAFPIEFNILISFFRKRTAVLLPRRINGNLFTIVAIKAFKLNFNRVHLLKKPYLKDNFGSAVDKGNRTDACKMKICHVVTSQA